MSFVRPWFSADVTVFFWSLMSIWGCMSDFWGSMSPQKIEEKVASDSSPSFGHFRVCSRISGVYPGDACHLFLNGDGCEVVCVCTLPIPRFGCRFNLVPRPTHFVLCIMFSGLFVTYHFVFSTFISERGLYTRYHESVNFVLRLLYFFTLV